MFCGRDSGCIDMQPGDSRPVDLAVDAKADGQIDGAGEGSLGLGAACTAAGQCTQGFCVDGVCCDNACGETCARCDQLGTEGTCTPLNGSDPDGECTGGTASDGCDGTCMAGACSYAAVPDGQSCGTDQCGTDPTQVGRFRTTRPECDGQGECVQRLTGCGAMTCTSGGDACRAGCVQLSDCIGGSACDRRQAHQTGTGVCVEPATVAVVSDVSGLTTALAGAMPVIRLDDGTYSANLSIARDVALISSNTGGARIRPAADDHTVQVSGTTALSLQGLVVEDNTHAGRHGVACAGTDISNKATLAVIESLIKDSDGLGVSSSNCDIAIRRSVLTKNDAGGLSHNGGDAVLANSVFRNNGTGGVSLVGGISLSGAGQTRVDSCTVSGNDALGGVFCRRYLWRCVPDHQQHRARQRRRR